MKHRNPLVRALPISIALVLTVFAVAFAHDLFIHPRSFFLTTGDTARVDVLNGTFTSSEASLAFDRLSDVRVVGPAGTTRPDSSMWRVRGDSTLLTWIAGSSGTYVVGASVKPREISLTAEQFNGYLKEDGIPDVLEARRVNGELSRPAREQYAKNVKSLLQVGDARSPSFSTVLGHSAELVPLDNPYTLRPGAVFRVRALVDGKPVSGQLVLTGGITVAGVRVAESSVRTGADGVATLRLPAAGHWYVKFIHMVKATGIPGVDYQSKWATLTFGVR
jgi:uncharacterized GH25 family protein